MLVSPSLSLIVRAHTISQSRSTLSDQTQLFVLSDAVVGDGGEAHTVATTIKKSSKVIPLRPAVLAHSLNPVERMAQPMGTL